MRINRCRILLLILAGTLTGACGDIFSFEKKIVKDYYFIQADGTKDLGIYYRIEGDSYIGRVPEKVLAYGFNDTVLVAKQVGYNGKKLVYIIYMKNDSDFAEASAYLLDTVSEDGYLKKWDQRLRVKFKDIEYAEDNTTR